MDGAARIMRRHSVATAHLPMATAAAKAAAAEAAAGWRQQSDGSRSSSSGGGRPRTAEIHADAQGHELGTTTAQPCNHKGTSLQPQNIRQQRTCSSSPTMRSGCDRSRSSSSTRRPEQPCRATDRQRKWDVSVAVNASDAAAHRGVLPAACRQSMSSQPPKPRARLACW